MWGGLGALVVDGGREGCVGEREEHRVLPAGKMVGGPERRGVEEGEETCAEWGEGRVERRAIVEGDEEGEPGASVGDGGVIGVDGRVSALCVLVIL